MRERSMASTIRYPLLSLVEWEVDGDIQATKRRFPRLHSLQQRHLASIPLFVYSFLMVCPPIIIGLKMDIDTQNKIPLRQVLAIRAIMGVLRENL